MAYLIDTSIFIALERRGKTLADLAALVPNETIALASITASELLAGIHRADTPERGRQRTVFVEAILSQTPVLDFDLRVARIHAGLWAELATRGQQIGAHDLIIAATALAHGATVLTQDARSFGRVPGLPVRIPVW